MDFSLGHGGGELLVILHRFIQQPPIYQGRIPAIMEGAKHKMSELTPGQFEKAHLDITQAPSFFLTYPTCRRSLLFPFSSALPQRGKAPDIISRSPVFGPLGEATVLPLS